MWYPVGTVVERAERMEERAMWVRSWMAEPRPMEEVWTEVLTVGLRTGA
jgi:hypothetical protein